MSYCLHPLSDPFNQGYLRVSDRHELYFEQRGNPKGIPVVLLHGGPGGGCRAGMSQYFNPDLFNITLFDQRGAMRSRPFADMTDNTSTQLVEDIEKIRLHVGVNQWIVSGGSWGTALALLYAQSYPDRCLELILRGVTFVEPAAGRHLYHGMEKFFPDAYDDLIALIPEDERQDLVTAFYTRLMNPDPAVHMPAARAFTKYDTICATLLPSPLVEQTMKDEQLVLSLARAFTHYCYHNFFLEEDQIQTNLPIIAHLPVHIVHGRYDIICPVQTAYAAHKALPLSTLTIVPDAGHATLEPGITQRLLEIGNDLGLKYAHLTTGSAA